MRVEWDLTGFDFDLADFPTLFEPIAKRYALRWRLERSDQPHRLAIFVSKYDHCLADLLYRHQAGELACEIPLIVANHPDARRWADFHGIPFHVLPIEPGKKAEGEAKQLALLKEHGIDLVVLARYMQVLSPAFVAAFPYRIINVHHSFLPAFVGAKPYHRAFDRGVKLIGATSHYVTDELDEGPIIEQDVVRVSHRDAARKVVELLKNIWRSNGNRPTIGVVTFNRPQRDLIEDLLEKGRDMERSVLSKAVRWHLDHRILVYGHKTVVFD